MLHWYYYLRTSPHSSKLMHVFCICNSWTSQKAEENKEGGFSLISISDPIDLVDVTEQA